MFEFEGEGVHYLGEARKRDLFSAPSYDFRDRHLARGRIPAQPAGGQPACLRFENGPRAVEPQAVLTDACSGKSATLSLGQARYRDWWHTALLPVVYPLTIAADIALSPLYACGMIWCRYHSCTPM